MLRRVVLASLFLLRVKRLRVDEWQTLHWSDCLDVWHDTQLLMLSDVLVQDSSQALTQRRKMVQRERDVNGLKKKGGGMPHHQNLTNGAICLSVFTPASAVVNCSQCRGAWLFAFILSNRIFLCVLICVYFNTKEKPRKLGLSAGMLRCGGIQSAKGTQQFSK